MNYLTYEDYAALGGGLSEGEFARRAGRACRVIDRMTHGRLRGESPVREAVKRAVFDMVEEASERDVQTLVNDGVRVTYFGRARSDEDRMEAVARAWLEGEAVGGVSVLYAGVDA